MIFRTSFLYMLSCNSSFLFVDSIALICPLELMLYLKTFKFLSMVLRTIMWILAIIWILDIRIQIQYVNFVFTKYSLTIFFFQLSNPFLLPSSILLRLMNIYLFRSNNKLLFLTSSFLGISNRRFLIPCYHQNSKGNVKHILFQQSPPF